MMNDVYVQFEWWSLVMAKGIVGIQKYQVLAMFYVLGVDYLLHILCSIPE